MTPPAEPSGSPLTEGPPAQAEKPIKPWTPPPSVHTTPALTPLAPPKSALSDVLDGASTRGWAIVDRTIRQTLLRKATLLVIALLLMPAIVAGAWVSSPDLAATSNINHQSLDLPTLLTNVTYPSAIAQGQKAVITFSFEFTGSEPIECSLRENSGGNYGIDIVRWTMDPGSNVTKVFQITSDRLVRYGNNPVFYLDTIDPTRPYEGGGDYYSLFIAVAIPQVNELPLALVINNGLSATVEFDTDVLAGATPQVRFLLANTAPTSMVANVSVAAAGGTEGLIFNRSVTVPAFMQGQVVALDLADLPPEREVIDLFLSLESGGLHSNTSSTMRQVLALTQEVHYGSVRQSIVDLTITTDLMEQVGVTRTLVVQGTSHHTRPLILSAEVTLNRRVYSSVPVRLEPHSQSPLIVTIPAATRTGGESWQIRIDVSTADGLAFPGADQSLLSVEEYTEVSVIDEDPEEFQARGILILSATFVYLTFGVTFVSLVYAGTAISSEVETKTLQMMAVKPIRRLEILLYKYIGTALSLPVLVLPPIVGSYLILGIGAGGSFLSSNLSVLGAFLLAAFLGLLAYSALFMMISTLTKHPLAISGLYVFMWELNTAFTGGALCGPIASSLSQSSIMHYLKSVAYDLIVPDHAVSARLIFPNISGGAFGVQPAPLAIAIAVPLLVMVIMLALGVLRLESRDLD